MSAEDEDDDEESESYEVLLLLLLLLLLVAELGLLLSEGELELLFELVGSRVRDKVFDFCVFLLLFMLVLVESSLLEE